MKAIPAGLDREIERLYQLPLEDFTAARNELAKGAGKRASEVKALAKPPLAAWAVNQIYWKRRTVYDALIEAADEARRAHKAVLAGRAADVRTAGKEHDDRVSAALDAALEILVEAGHPATDATRQAVLTTLRALPGDEPAGRLTRTLQPGGFEALAGLLVGGKGTGVGGRGTGAAGRGAGDGREAERGPKKSKDEERREKAAAKARDAVTHASRAVKQAEHAAQREEFERARAAREADKAAAAVNDAKKAVEEAESELRDREAEQAAAAKKKDAAERRAQEAEKAVDAARAALEKAQAELDSATLRP